MFDNGGDGLRLNVRDNLICFHEKQQFHVIPFPSHHNGTNFQSSYSSLNIFAKDCWFPSKQSCYFVISIHVCLYSGAQMDPARLEKIRTMKVRL